MHEIGIASSILECVAAEAEKHPGAQLASVCVRIGELSNVDKDALEFAFEALTRDTGLEHLKLVVERVPRLPEVWTLPNDLQQWDGARYCIPGIGGAVREVVEKKVLSENDRLAAGLR